MRNFLQILAAVIAVGIPLLAWDLAHWRAKRRLKHHLPARHQSPLTETRQRIRDEIDGARRTREEIDQMLCAAHTRLAPLYDTPTRKHADH